MLSHQFVQESHSADSTSRASCLSQAGERVFIGSDGPQAPTGDKLFVGPGSMGRSKRGNINTNVPPEERRNLRYSNSDMNEHNSLL